MVCNSFHGEQRHGIRDGIRWTGRKNISQSVSDRCIARNRLVPFASDSSKITSAGHHLFSFIFAGAVGNIIDSAVYGVLFSDSMNGVSTFLPAEGGYSSFLHGRVVDMLYFPLFSGRFPDWLPIWGGETFLFFRPVFNIADSSISIGVMLFIIFQNKFSPAQKKKDETLPEENAVIPQNGESV